MRRFLVGALMIGLVLGSIATPTLASARRTPFAASETSGPVQPGKTWMSGHVIHIRGQLDEGPVTGDLEGSITIALNLNLDLRTNIGELFGKFTISTESVTWSGSFTGSVTAEAGSVGRFTGQGTDGTKLMGTFTQTGQNTFALKGTILDPHG